MSNCQFNRNTASGTSAVSFGGTIWLTGGLQYVVIIIFLFVLYVCLFYLMIFAALFLWVVLFMFLFFSFAFMLFLSLYFSFFLFSLSFPYLFLLFSSHMSNIYIRESTASGQNAQGGAMFIGAGTIVSYNNCLFQQGTATLGGLLFVYLCLCLFFWLLCLFMLVYVCLLYVMSFYLYVCVFYLYLRLYFMLLF